MNEASRWRLEIARHVAPIIARNPKVRAIVLGGSVSRGNADAYSDIEIGVFWAGPPTDEERMAPIEPAGGVFWELDPYDPGEQTWMNEWGLGGVKMDVRNLTVEGLERKLADVARRADIDEFKQMAVSTIQYGIALHNPSLLEHWQAQIATYPAALAEAMIQEYMVLDSWCWWVEMLATRGDLPLVYSAFSEIARHILSMLMGLNHIYHPGLKWMQRLVDEMTVAPENLDQRIQQAFRAEPLDGMAIFRDLMLETYDLIDTHIPQVETAEARSAFLRQRPQVATMPNISGLP